MIKTVIDAFKKYWPGYDGDISNLDEYEFNMLLGMMALRGATEEELDCVCDDYDENYAS